VHNGKKKAKACVGKRKVSPLKLTKEKIPYERKQDFGESAAVSQVAPAGFGGGRQDHLKGDVREAGCVLPPGQTNLESCQEQRHPRVDSRQRGPDSSESGFRLGVVVI
jgi:hypothetical protein